MTCKWSFLFGKTTLKKLTVLQIHHITLQKNEIPYLCVINTERGAWQLTLNNMGHLIQTVVEEARADIM
jgi:hypothetical protein